MTDDPNLCPFAAHVTDLRPDRPRRRPVYGLVVHQSGRSIVEQATRLGQDVLEHCVAYYREAPCSAHYVCGPDGTLGQITPDDRHVAHVGVSADERRRYLSGAWEAELPAGAVARWHRAWPHHRSPQHLYPGPSANEVYAGVECPPLVEPLPDGRWHTDAQHATVARLAADLARRHGWPAWPTVPRGEPGESAPRPRLPCPRLLGHEDLDGYGRWQASGGWDPGALRARPRWSWALVASALAGLLPP